MVDDGSVDDTREVIQEAIRHFPFIRLHSLERNGGKGKAVREGALAARGARILMTDADGSTPASEIEKLLAALDEGFDIAVGSRVLRDETSILEAKSERRFIGFWFRLAVRILCVKGVEDTQCGFKIFTRNAAQFLFQRQQEDRFAFDVEILRLAELAGLRTKEVPVSWYHVAGSRIDLIKDSIAMLLALFRIRRRLPNSLRATLPEEARSL